MVLVAKCYVITLIFVILTSYSVQITNRIEARQFLLDLDTIGLTLVKRFHVSNEHRLGRFSHNQVGFVYTFRLL